MPSHGATKLAAAEAEPKHEKMSKVLHHIELTAARNGGAMAEHSFTHYEHKPEVHVFGAGDGHKLAAHIEKHLGIKMPGKSSTDKAESKEQESSEHEE